MTTLFEPAWLTYAEYRELVGAPPLAIVADGDGVTIDALGRRWDPRKHPRGRDGRFIEVGGLVKFFDSLNGRQVAGSGTVTRIDGDSIHVHVTSSNRNPREVGGSQVFNKRQIATIPPTEVRLDRRGNVHPEDRELPDKNGKLVRVGDTVKVGNESGKVTRVDDNSGRVVVRNAEGLHVMRRVETVERQDDAPEAPAEGEPIARLDTPAPRNPTPRGAPAPPAPETPDGPAARIARRLEERRNAPPPPANTEERVAQLPEEQPLTPDAFEAFLEQNGFEPHNATGAHHLGDDDARQGIENDRAYGRMKLEHDRALHQVMPTEREQRAISNWRKLRATMDAPRPEARLDTPPAPAPDAPSTVSSRRRDRILARLQGENRLPGATDRDVVNALEAELARGDHFQLTPADMAAVRRALAEKKAELDRPAPDAPDVAGVILGEFDQGGNGHAPKAEVHVDGELIGHVLRQQRVDPGSGRRTTVYGAVHADGLRINTKTSAREAANALAESYRDRAGEGSPVAPVPVPVPAPRNATPRGTPQAPVRRADLESVDADLNGQRVPDGWRLREEDSDGRQIFENEDGYEVHVGDEYELYDPNSEHLGDFGRFDSADREALDDAGANGDQNREPPDPAPAAGGDGQSPPSPAAPPAPPGGGDETPPPAAGSHLAHNNADAASLSGVMRARADDARNDEAREILGQAADLLDQFQQSDDKDERARLAHQAADAIGRMNYAAHDKRALQRLGDAAKNETNVEHPLADNPPHIRRPDGNPTPAPAPALPAEPAPAAQAQPVAAPLTRPQVPGQRGGAVFWRLPADAGERRARDEQVDAAVGDGDAEADAIRAFVRQLPGLDRHDREGRALATARYHAEDALLADNPEDRAAALMRAARGLHDASMAHDARRPGRAAGTARVRRFNELRRAFEESRPAEATPDAPPTPDAPALPRVRNLPPGRRVEADDGPGFSASAVDQMLSDLPVARGRHRALAQNDRYLNNLRYALQDALEGKNNVREADGPLDQRINDYFERALQGRSDGDPTRQKIKDVQRTWRAMRAGAANAPESEPDAPELDSDGDPREEPWDVNQWSEALHAATNEVDLNRLEREIEADPDLTEADKFYLAGLVNQIRDAGPANADPQTPDSGRDENADAINPPGRSPLPSPPNLDTPPGEQSPDLGGQPIGAPVPAPRQPRMMPGVRGRGQFANAVIRNRHGDELRNGVMVQLPGGMVGYVARMHPPSNRVVIKNREGLEVMRDADTVRALYTGGDAPAAPAAPPFVQVTPGMNPGQVDDAVRGIAPERDRDGERRAGEILAMHEEGVRRGFPLEREVGAARGNITAARQAAEQRNQPEMIAQLQQAIENYGRALTRGINNRDLAEDVERRRAAAQQLLDDLNNGLAFAGDPDFDAALGVNVRDLAAVRGMIPNRLQPGAGDARIFYRNAGYALGDALDDTNDLDVRQRALVRARTQLERAVSLGHPGAQAVLDALTRIQGNAGGAPGAPAGRRAPSRLVRPNVARPVHPAALNGSAREEDYAPTWGYERGHDIARAARERPSLDAIRAATGVERKRLVEDAFNGEYGNTGLQFKVRSVSGTRESFTVYGTVVSAQGRSVGTFERRIGRSDVYNAYFQIEDSVRAGGAATEFNRHMEDWYIANGIRQVTVSAGLTHGGFVWARNGFDWSGGGKHMAESLLQRIERFATTPEARADAAAIKRRIETLDADDPNFPTPFELSAIGWKPGMGRNDAWAGKQGMLGTGWGGTKKLDPNARAYKVLVARGRMPNPADTVRPAPPEPELPRRYTSADVPDEIRAMTFDQLSVVGAPGSVGNVGRFQVHRLSRDPNDAEVGGINDTFLVTDPTNGRQFFVKRDSDPAHIQAEVNAANMINAVGMVGASHVEAHPTDPLMMIGTYVGEQEGLTNYRKAGPLRRQLRDPDAADAFLANMADPDEVITARLVNLALVNFDRHGNNAYFAQDADGRDHLLLFDHGLSLSPLAAAFGSLEEQVRMQQASYLQVLKARFRQLGDSGSPAELARIAGLMRGRISASPDIDDAVKAQMVDRLDQVIANPQPFYDIMKNAQA